MELGIPEQAQLAAFVNTDGFKILCGIMKDEVLKFNAALLSAKKPEDVIISHNLASAAAKFYEGFLNRIDSEIYMYTGTPKKGDAPIDITAGILDMDEEE